jgi:hypothetical protein
MITPEQAECLIRFLDENLYNGTVETEDDYVLLETLYDKLKNDQS